MFSNDDNILKSAVLEAFPEFKNSTFTFNHCGWTSIIVDIDNDFICKFPRTLEKYVFLQKESALLEKISQHIPNIELPKRKHISGNFPFFIHKKLKGDFLTVEKFNMCSSSEQQNFINSVADFFIAFHNMPISEFKNIIPYKNEKLPDIDFLWNMLSDDFVNEENVIKQILSDFTSLIDNSPLIVGYYDFHCNNVIIDLDTKKIKAVFDFDEVAIGSSKFDLREIYLNYNCDIGQKVLKAYNKKTKNPLTDNTLYLSLAGWALYEYVKMKQRLNSGELKDVENIDLYEFKLEILSMLKLCTKG